MYPQKIAGKLKKRGETQVSGICKPSAGLLNSVTFQSLLFSSSRREEVLVLRMYGKILFVVALCVVSVIAEGQKIRKCNIPPTAPRRIEKVINQCQDEIKVAILAEALQAASLIDSPKTRSKRETFTAEEKRIAGCLLQCVYRKMKAVNEKGFPTVEGLVSLYTEGIEDKEYILATLQSVNFCLAKAQKEFITTPQSLEAQGQTCLIAYDVFDCVSEKIGEYCGQTP